jgi:hypothetical protein
MEAGLPLPAYCVRQKNLREFAQLIDTTGEVSPYRSLPTRTKAALRQTGHFLFPFWASHSGPILGRVKYLLRVAVHTFAFIGSRCVYFTFVTNLLTVVSYRTSLCRCSLVAPKLAGLAGRAMWLASAILTQAPKERRSHGHKDWLVTRIRAISALGYRIRALMLLWLMPSAAGPQFRLPQSSPR